MKKTRCVYIARTTLPSTAANTVHVMKISDEFNKIFDGSFKLLVHEKLEDTDSLCDSYGTDKFCIEEISVDAKDAQLTYAFAWKAARHAWKLHPDVVITRDPMTALALGVMGTKVVLDIHGDVRHLCGRGYHFFKIRQLVRRENIRYTAVTNGLREFFTQEYGKTFERTCVLPNGVTLQNFKHVSMDGIFGEEHLRIGYIGKLTVGKGVDMICKLAKNDPYNKYYVYGGSKEDAEAEIKDSFPDNVFFGGYVDNKKVPSLVENLDVVLLPNKADQVCQGERMGNFTSPIKMFEYMAFGRPIIASDIPVLREILNDENSYLVPEDDVDKWLEVIRLISRDPESALRKSAAAKSDVQNYTWENRARNILKEAGISAGEAGM